MTEKLKVYILGDYRPSLADGLAEFSYQNAKLLNDTLDIHFVEFDDTQNRSYFSTVQIDGVSVIRFGTKNISSIQLHDSFISLLKSLPARGVIFHLNHIYNLKNFLVAKKLVKYSIPYIITPHDSYVYGADFRKSRPFFERTYRDIFVRLFDKYVLDHAVVCHALTNRCLACLRSLTQTSIKIVHNQISDINIKFDPNIIKDQLCFIGRFDINVKGIDRLISGFKRFKASDVGNDAIRLILVGPHPEGPEAVETKLFQSFPITMRGMVKITGKVDEKTRNKILSESKVYVHMSRFEGFGLSVIQALASFTPVIISRQVPTSDIIENYGAGIVVDTDDEFSRALENIFKMSDQEYAELCSKTRRCYETEFHPDVIKPQLLDLYRSAENLLISTSGIS